VKWLIAAASLVLDAGLDEILPRIGDDLRSVAELDAHRKPVLSIAQRSAGQMRDGDGDVAGLDDEVYAARQRPLEADQIDAQVGAEGAGRCAVQIEEQRGGADVQRRTQVKDGAHRKAPKEGGVEVGRARLGALGFVREPGIPLAVDSAVPSVAEPIAGAGRKRERGVIDGRAGGEVKAPRRARDR